MLDEAVKKRWVNDAMSKATPVARRWAAHLMKEKGKDFADIEEDFFNVMFVEIKLYDSMKKSLVNHIERHGLDAKGLEYLEEFKAIKYFNFHTYEAVLRRVRRTFVRNEQEIERQKHKRSLFDLNQPEKDAFDAKLQEMNRSRVEFWRENNNYSNPQIDALQKQNDNLEYLIAKINEFLRKVRDLNSVAFQMLLDGNAPDLNAWSVQMVLNDNLFEENKQFLKQTLHHIECLEENHFKLGVAEIKLLLYHEQGCRRVKLYKMVESEIINIFYLLNNEQERRTIYPEICSFVARLVPQVGYVSPHMINFIFDRGFISEITRDLLINIKPVINQLNMTPLILLQLKKFFNETLERLRQGKLTETDEYVLEIMQAYSPKEISPTIAERWALFKSQTN